MLEISYARFIKRPDWLPRNPVRTGARANGERFERRVHATLLKRYPDKYIEGPWIAYRGVNTGNRVRFCQPDGLYIDIKEGLLVIIEAKLKHGSRAWEQLNDLYYPCLRHIMEGGKLFEIRLIEVVKWFDPLTFREMPPAMCSTIHGCTPMRENVYNVHLL